ncbi:MAG TPA: hypothetical protein VJ861_09220 [Treponemataceae bacterium]|nr:hypothetical protein [Treponemataceae bacterium]
MKFKTLLVVFNIVIILSFLIVFFLPFFILDAQYMQIFWSKNWVFGCFFLCVVVIINILFFLNWKTLSLLENEDWPALSQYLEHEVFQKNKFSNRNVRLLIDSLLLMGEFSTIRTLDETLRKNKTSLAERYRLRFSISAMLCGDYEYMNLLSSMGTKSSAYDKEWLLFFNGLSYQLNKKFDQAADSYLQILNEAKSALVLVLSAFLCNSVLAKALPSRQESLTVAALEAQQLVLSRYNKNKWDRLVSDEKGEMHIIVLGKMLKDSTTWLFK